MKVEVVGTFRDIRELQEAGIPLALMGGRRFTRWYTRNKKTVYTLASIAILSVCPHIAFAETVKHTFFSGHGVILLHMLIVGFLTLVVTTFLRFTGRGDLAPLVMFVGGAVILYECMELFNDIYKGVETFFNM